MMKYYFNLAKYAPGRTTADIQAVHVTDYYRLEPIDGRTAFYVSGSDVYGPMGKELIPFEKEAGAQEFMKDQGKGSPAFRTDRSGPRQKPRLMPTRKSTLFFIFVALGAVSLALMAAHSQYRNVKAQTTWREKARMVEWLELTDLCLFTDARYARHPSMADRHTPFQDRLSR